MTPALAGLLVAPSVAGLLIAAVAVLGSLARALLQLIGTDVRRDWWLERSQLARALATAKIAGVAGIAVVVTLATDIRWLVPLAVATPFIAVSTSFEVRDRGDELAPALLAAVAFGAAAPAIILVGGGDGGIAAAIWLILSARVVATIPFVRTQIARSRRPTVSLVHSDLVQLLSIVIAAGAIAIDDRVTAGCLAIGILAGVQLVAVRRPPLEAKTLARRQLTFQIGIVIATAAGVAVS